MRLTTNLKKTFLDLIAISEVYPHEREIVRYVLERLTKVGFPAQTDSFGNVVVSVAGEGEPILLSTHLDIPEPNPNVRFVDEGTVIRSDGTNILGADPKSGLAVILEFLIDLSRDKRSHRPIEVLLTRGEEAGAFGALNADYESLKATTGIVLDENGPITKIVEQAPFYVRFDVECIGKAAHPRQPERGANALQALVASISELPWGYATEGVSWNIGLLQAGTARNSVPGKASLQGELRSFDKERLLTQAELLAEDIKQRASAISKVECKVSYALEFEGFTINHTDPFVQKVVTAIESMGLKSDFYQTFGGSDANIFNAKGIACLAMGAGYYNAHHYTEYVDLKDMADIHDFLGRLVRDGV